MNRSLVAGALLFGFLVAVSPAARADDTVVHVDASSAIILERVNGDGHATPVCRAPCDEALDQRSTYQLTGEELRTSNQFQLPKTASATIDVKPRTSSSFTTGIILVTISGVLLTGGLFLLGASFALGSGSLGNAFGAVFADGGAILCGVGALATGVPGMLLLTNNIQSRARVFEDDRVAARAPTMPMPLLTRSF